MLGDLLADDAAFAHEKREGTLRKVVCFHGFDNEATHDFSGTDVRVVGHHDDRAARGKGRGGVTSGHGVSEGEVAGAEDGDRANRTKQRTVIRLGERFAIWIRGLDTGVDPFAFLDQVGEETELAHRAADLTLAARFGQTSFLGGPGDQGRCRGFDAGGDVAEEGGLLLSGKSGERRGGLGG